MTYSRRVSVVVPFHNRSAYIRESVASILREIDPNQDELILVDDASTEDQSSFTPPAGVKLIRLERRVGPAEARNVGVRAARGQYLTFLDSDDILIPKAITKRVAYLQEHPEETAVGGRVGDIIDSQGKRRGGPELITFYSPPPSSYRLSWDYLSVNRSLPLQLWLVLFRREVFDSVGELSRWLSCGEDLDFFCRYLKKYTVPFIDCDVADYRVHDNNISLRFGEEGKITVSEAALAAQSLVCARYGLPLPGSPVLRRTYFSIGGVSVCLEHANDSLGEKLEKEYASFVTSDQESSVFFKISSGVSPKRPERGSIRIRYWEEFKSYAYALGEKKRVDLFDDNYYAEKDFEKMTAEVSYRKLNSFVSQMGAGVFKWMLIKNLEKNGYGYLHGACVEWRGKFVFFCGDPGSGKSSCALRLQRAGGRIITDDSILFKEGTVLPLDKTPSMRGDFRDRFKLEDGGDYFRRTPAKSPVPGQVSTVVFPRVWESSVSQIRGLEKPDAFERLVASYLKETDWNTYPENLALVRERYENLLGQAKFLEFLAGDSESEVEQTLIQFFRAEKFPIEKSLSKAKPA